MNRVGKGRVEQRAMEQGAGVNVTAIVNLKCMLLLLIQKCIAKA